MKPIHLIVSVVYSLAVFGYLVSITGRMLAGMVGP